MNNLKSQVLVLLLCIVCLLSGAYAQLTPSADAYTNTADPATNYGAKTTLDVESASQTTYIRFDWQNGCKFPATNWLEILYSKRISHRLSDLRWTMDVTSNRRLQN